MIPNKNYRILAVDDLEDNLFLLQTILESEGYEVQTATSGRDALKHIKQRPPDLVLLDVMMPEMTGFEVTEKIRKQENFQQLAILLLTAFGDEAAEAAIKAGANDYIRKPIEIEELLTKVQIFCR